jgi:hypothetical protein
MQSVFSKLMESTAGGKSNRPPPRFVWRSTVPPCGFARCFEANPQTAADMNSLLIERLRREEMPRGMHDTVHAPFWSSFIDGYDLVTAIDKYYDLVPAKYYDLVLG